MKTDMPLNKETKPKQTLSATDIPIAIHFLMIFVNETECTHTHTHTYIYIYIRDRERKR